MKIAYVIDIKKDNKSIGVLKKIEAQINEWRKLGHNVEEICLFDFYPSLDSKLAFLPKKISTFIRIYINSFALRSLIKQKQFDCIYSRAMLFTPFLMFLKRHNYVMELNANDLDEYKKTSRPLFHYARLTRSFMFSLPKGFIAVSNEIRDYYSNFKKPTLVLANACPDLVFPQRIHHLNPRPLIGFIGSNQYIWNGSEKVLKLASRMPEYDFEFIGFKLENAPANVRTLGFMKEEESIEVMKKWNAAISTLSLYEQNLQEASPLKSRLYLAMNIPFIYAYDDTDEPFSHCLKIPNTPDNVDSHFKEIEAFFKKTFALESVKINHNCNLDVKEKKRLDFMQSLVSQKR